MNTTPNAAAPEPEIEDLDGLRLRGDVDALLELAKAYRSGAAAGGRDLGKCLAAYRAAAELGSPEAAYAVALFHMTGGSVPQDTKEGTTLLRAAAERGSVPAKVYLGNLYELGIHYKADPEKADVWYRNAARGAGVGDDPRELAELGCVRHVLAVTADPELPEADRARLLARARAHGHGLKLRGGDVPAAAEPTPAAPGASTPGAPAAAPVPAPAKTSPALEPSAKESRPRTGGPSQASLGLAAFGYAALFVAAGIGAGYAAMLGARELVGHGRLLPGLGARAELVFPAVFAAVGVLPSLLVYRFGTVLKALLLGAVVGGLGWLAWGTGVAALHRWREEQAAIFAVAGYAAALLVLGLLGGTKKKPQRRR